MLSALRAIGAYRQRDGNDRIRRMKLEVERHPDGHAKYYLAIILWEENDLVEAQQLATPLLEESPEDFYLLAICLSYYLQTGDAPRIDELARRLAVAKNPARFDRVIYPVLNVLLSPLWLFGYRRRTTKYADGLDAWADWAREYVRVNPVDV